MRRRKCAICGVVAWGAGESDGVPMIDRIGEKKKGQWNVSFIGFPLVICIRMCEPGQLQRALFRRAKWRSVHCPIRSFYRRWEISKSSTSNIWQTATDDWPWFQVLITEPIYFINALLELWNMEIFHEFSSECWLLRRISNPFIQLGSTLSETECLVCSCTNPRGHARHVLQTIRHPELRYFPIQHCFTSSVFISVFTSSANISIIIQVI